MRAILLSLLFLNALIINAQELHLKLASDVWPPFTDIAEERTFALDLVKTALNRSATSVSTEILEFDDVLSGIKEGKFDGSAALWHSPEREENLLFSDPYLQNQLILVGRKGSDVSATSFNDLGGKRIAVVGNYAYGIEENSELELVYSASDQENLELLLKKEADYMLVDALLIQYLLTYQEKKALQYLEIGTKALITKNLHFALRKDLPEAENIMHQFNMEVLRMVADGSYNKVLQLNWIHADVDSDGKMELVLNGNQAGTVAPSSSYAVYFSDSNTAGASKTNNYYVGGNFYESWEQIPSQYKVPAKKENDLSKIGLLSFGF